MTGPGTTPRQPEGCIYDGPWNNLITAGRMSHYWALEYFWRRKTGRRTSRGPEDRKGDLSRDSGSQASVGGESARPNCPLASSRESVSIPPPPPHISSLFDFSVRLTAEHERVYCVRRAFW